MKKLLGMVVMAAISLTATGCASDKEFLQAQMQAQREARAEQKPLFELVAHEGQQITGLAGLKVYLPVTAAPLQQSRSEWSAVVNQALGITGTVLGIKYAGQAAIGLAREVGQASTAGYAHVQAPGGISTTTTLSGTGTLGGGAYSASDSTHAPTVVTQPAAVVVEQPAPVIVQQPAPVIVP